MAAVANTLSTPVNTISRENLPVLIRNNVLDRTLEFDSDCDIDIIMMETDSPLSKKNLQPISKKLFHSPIPEQSPKMADYERNRKERSRQNRKRKQNLVPNSSENIKRAYVQECDREGYSPDVCGGMRKKVLISLFHNREYSLDYS